MFVATLTTVLDWLGIIALARAWFQRRNCPTRLCRLRIEYLDCVTDELRRVTLVYPGDDVLGSRRVSVLSPLGSVLIGLRKRQRITWRTALGGWLEVEVRRVERDVRADRRVELPQT